MYRAVSVSHEIHLPRSTSFKKLPDTPRRLGNPPHSNTKYLDRSFESLMILHGQSKSKSTKALMFYIYIVSSCPILPFHWLQIRSSECIVLATIMGRVDPFCSLKLSCTEYRLEVDEPEKDQYSTMLVNSRLQGSIPDEKAALLPMLPFSRVLDFW